MSVVIRSGSQVILLVFHSRLNLFVYTSMLRVFPEQAMMVVEASFRGALQVAVSAGTIVALLPKYKDANGDFQDDICDEYSGSEIDSVLAWLTTLIAWFLTPPMLLFALKIVRNLHPSCPTFRSC